MIPLSQMPQNPKEYADTRNARVSLAFVLPSDLSVAKVCAYLNSGAERSSYAASALAASVFLSSVRGLVSDDINIETPRGTFNIMRSEDGEYGVLLPKCKVLRSKSLEFSSSIEARCSEVFTNRGIVRVFECADARAYSDQALSLFSLGEEGENICASVAVSLNGGRLRMKSHTVSAVENADLYSLVCGVSVLSHNETVGFPLFADLSGIVFRAEPMLGMLHISTPVSFMSKPISKKISGT